MSFVVTDSKYQEAARLRNLNIQQQLLLKLEQLKLDAQTMQLRISRQQNALRTELCEVRNETQLLKQRQEQQSANRRRRAATSTASRSKPAKMSMFYKLNKEIELPSSKHRTKSAPPSISIDQFDRRLRQWKRERMSSDRQACCIHIDPRSGTPFFAPNVETASINGGFHISMY